MRRRGGSHESEDTSSAALHCTRPSLCPAGPAPASPAQPRRSPTLLLTWPPSWISSGSTASPAIKSAARAARPVDARTALRRARPLPGVLRSQGCCHSCSAVGLQGGSGRCAQLAVSQPRSGAGKTWRICRSAWVPPHCSHPPAYPPTTHRCSGSGCSMAASSAAASADSQGGTAYSAAAILWKRVGRSSSSKGRHPASITYSTTPGEGRARRAGGRAGEAAGWAVRAAPGVQARWAGR